MITKDEILEENYNKNIKIQPYTKTSESLKLAFLLAIVGGFLDAYTFICRGEVFANAQTGNIVLLGIEITKRDYLQAFMAFLPILAFIVGVITAEHIKDLNLSSTAFISGAESFILILEIIVLIIIGFIPPTVPHIFVTVPISFVSSVQISSFRTLIDSPYCTTMCTGNLRSACHAAYIAFTKKDNKSARNAAHYGLVILSFLIGACIGGILTSLIGFRSIWFSAIILAFSLFLHIIDEQKLLKNSTK